MRLRREDRPSSHVVITAAQRRLYVHLVEQIHRAKRDDDLEAVDRLATQIAELTCSFEVVPGPEPTRIKRSRRSRRSRFADYLRGVADRVDEPIGEQHL